MAKNQAAAALAKRRWKGVSKAEKSEVGRKLAKASADALTTEQKKERARHAARVRWSKPRKSKKE